MATSPSITSVWPPDWTSAGPQTPDYPLSVTDTSLGIILPLAALSLFMVFIVAGLLWNAWHTHRVRNYESHATANFLRYQDNENCRGSTRSTTPLRNSGTHTHHFRSGLYQINECGTSREEDSLSSVLSRCHHDVATISTGKSTPGFNVHSYPTVVISAQPPFSPYHLQWLTPPPRMVQSDPSMVSTYAKYMTPHCRVPFNTPTEGSDVDCVATGHVINDTHSYASTDVTSCPRYGYHGNMSGCSSLSDGNIPLSMMTSAPRDADNRQSTRHAQWPESSHHKHYTTNVAVSCLTNQCRFRWSGRAAAHAMPPSQSQTRSDVAATQYASQGLSYPATCLYPSVHPRDNYPCPPDYPSTSVYPQHHDLPRYPEEHGSDYLQDGTTVNLSTVPMMGSSNDTSTSQLAAISSISMCPTEGASTNTSTCGHVDSCETSQSMERSSSTMTAYNTSGYNAGPSHSTSINNSRNPSQDVSIANIRGMSTISRVPTDIGSPPSSILPLTHALSSHLQDVSTSGSSHNNTYSVQDIHDVPDASGPEWESYANGPSAPHSDTSRGKDQSSTSDGSSATKPVVDERLQTDPPEVGTPTARPVQLPAGVRTTPLTATPTGQTKLEKDELNAIRASFRKGRSTEPPLLAEKKFWV